MKIQKKLLYGLVAAGVIVALIYASKKWGSGSAAVQPMSSGGSPSPAPPSPVPSGPQIPV